MSKNLLVESQWAGTRIVPLYEAGVGIDGQPKKTLKIEGTAIVCDIPGINGRSYPKSILEAEVRRFNEKFVSKGRASAELNHPRLTAQGDGKDYSVFEMNLMKTCAVIEQLEFRGNELYCKMAVVRNHPAGEALAALLEAGYVPGYSLRGAGSVEDSGRGFMTVSDDYRLITIDVVGNPSFDDMALVTAFQESIGRSKATILTEAVDMTARETLGNIAHRENIKVNRTQFSRTGLLEAIQRSHQTKGSAFNGSPLF